MILVGIQTVFSSTGNGAEPSRTLAVVSTQEKEAKVAVVIGNSRYPSGALANPKNDATAMASALKKLGFDVELKLDASKADMVAVFKRFSSKAEKARVAALFYAGHGLQVNGSNYIVPIDASPISERDLKWEMVKLDDVIDDMGDAKVKLVFFDACRDNPLARSFSRGGSRGMAAPVEATGTLISFATKHGNTAADGNSAHSPYTGALLAALENPGGVEIEQMLRRVQQEVKRSTKGQQEPWRYGSLDGDFYFKAADPTNAGMISQTTMENALQEAARRSAEQAARERIEFQQSLKTQQEKSEKAVAEAVKKANEQAARDRAEMQLAMEKILKEALARQNAALETARRERAAIEPAAVQASQASKPVAEEPVQVALFVPTRPPTAAAGGKPGEGMVEVWANTPGDEWEYVARDEMFGKTQKLVLRVKAASAEGLLEEIVWNDGSAQEWVFGEHATVVGTPNESEFLFGSNWSARELSGVLLVEGGSGYCARPGNSCRLRLRPSGEEKLKTAAGTFDSIRLDGSITVTTDRFSSGGKVTVWYSKDRRRLLKQSAHLQGGPFNRIPGYKETIELSAVRPAKR